MTARTKRETRTEFFERNAKAGRSVRFSLHLDMNHLTDEERQAFDLKLGQIKIERGTLTPEKTAKLIQLVLHAEKD